MAHNNSNYGTIIGYLALLFWSMAAVLTTQLKNIPLFEILSIVMSISFLMTAAKLTIQDQWNKIKQPIILWVIGIIGVYGNNLFYVTAFKYAPPAQVDLINYFWPILIVIFAGLLPNEKFSLKYILASIFGLCGVFVLIIGHHGTMSFHTSYLKGYFFAFMDAIVWSAYTLTSRYYYKTPMEMVGMYCGIGAVISIISHFHFEHFISPSGKEWFCLIAMGLTTQGFAYFLWDYGVKHGDFKLLGVLSYANPIISVGMLVMLGMAHTSFALVIACLLVTLGGLIGGVHWQHIKWLYRFYPRYLINYYSKSKLNLKMEFSSELNPDSD